MDVHPTQQCTASERFLQLDNKRNGILRRCEQYARWTIPKIFPDANRNQDSETLSRDFQSLGAQATNNLANRLMMALFAPSRPFFRLDLSRKARREMEKQGVDPNGVTQLQSQFAIAESQASLELDKRSIRSKLYDLFKMLIVLGNALMILEKETVRVLSLRHYVVKRARDGQVVEMVIREKLHKDNIKKEVLPFVQNNPLWKPDQDGCYYEYIWLKWNGTKYNEDKYVDDVKLPAAFSSSYPKAKLPYHAVTWDLASGDDYGTGLVEDFEGDYRALSMLSQSTVHAAILASEFRWLVNPAGMTSVDDFQESDNGAALPGQKGDIELIASGVENNLQTNIAIQKMYIERIGSGFMLQSATVRDSERTTAYEIRKGAEELEGSLGGAYSRIAVDVQVPIAYWTMELTDKSIYGSDVEPTIITGLAALSRMGDRDRLLVFGGNLSSILSLPPQILDRLKLSAWIGSLAAAEGLDPNTFVLSEEEYNAMMQQRQQQQLAMQNAEQQVDNANQPEMQPQ